MSVRFVVGRAGSGKTLRCLEAIRARLRQDPVGGSRLLLLVPEQASFQMERALIETPDLAGFTRCEVLSFQRLAYRIFTDTGADPRRSDQTIGSLGRLMLLRRIIRQERPHLVLLSGVADKPGLIRGLSTAIDELMREKVEPEKVAEVLEHRCPDQPIVAARIADLTRIYRAYLDYLAADRMDPAQYLALAAERAGECPWLDGAEVWVDGFAGFTGRELELLTAVARRAESVEITMLVDPSASALTARELPKLSLSLFRRTEHTLVRLRQHFTAAGVPMDEPVRLRETHFRSPLLAQLETHLFRSKGERVHPDGSVRVLSVPDRREEVEAAAAEIQRLVRTSDPPLRYRDIAIIVRDLEPYHDLIAAAMRAHRIPCFIDRRQPTKHHPLVELVRSLLAVAADDCRLESVRLTLKTGLLPLSDSDADLLENYMLACGLAGRACFERPWTSTRPWRRRDEKNQLRPAQQAELERVNQLRERWLRAIGPWLAIGADHRERSGLEWARGLYACLEQMRVGERLAEWAEAAQRDGRSEEADAHRQVWVDFVGLLDEFVRALGSDEMGIDVFRETLEAGLAEFSLGLAPATLDQVLVGAIERSRHPHIRVALLLGFDEANFPRRRSEDPLLGDAEREALAAAGVEVGRSSRRALLDERMLAYIAMTRAGERLWISCPRAESDGKPLQPSAYLGDLQAALPGVTVETIDDAHQGRSVAGITTVRGLGERLAAEFRYRPQLDAENDLPARAAWNTLYEVVRLAPTWRHTAGPALAGLAAVNRAELPPGAIDRALPEEFVASVSRLERFAECPFAHFLEYTLKLEPRREAELQDVDLGTFCHAVLEGFVAQLAAEDKSLGDLEDDEINERLASVAGEVIPRLEHDLMLGEPRNAFMVERSKGHLARVALWQRDAARVGRFRPRKVEFPFGYEKNNRLTLETPGGRTIYLRGKIDRVDVAEYGDELLGLVIDYKRTTDRRLNMVQVYHGLLLQLVGYLLAIEQVGHTLTNRPIRPVGAYYLPLLEPYKSLAHPDEEKGTTYKFRGITSVDALEAVDRSVGPGGSSDFLAARLTKEGRPHKKTELAEPQQLRGIMAHVGRRMGELADGILDGVIAIHPYRLNRKMPCSYCPYKPVCRYEVQLQPARELAALERENAIAEMTGGDTA